MLFNTILMNACVRDTTLMKKDHNAIHEEKKYDKTTGGDSVSMMV